jgi:hypothetical protein
MSKLIKQKTEVFMEKAVLGRYAQLTQDLAFKKVFAAEEDKELLIAMLNLFLSV